MSLSDLDQPQFQRLYGPWASRTPRDVAALFGDYPGVWWIAGGWAIEAFTGVRREHDDIDPTVLRSDLPVLQEHLRGRLDLWAASSGALRPLLGDAELLPGANQVWTRQCATEPWEYDILLAPGDEHEWIYRRDQRIRLPMGDALWEHEGIRYLHPEIQLLYKAAGHRTKDQADFETAAPLLDTVQRHWLRNALGHTLPGHPWITSL